MSPVVKKASLLIGAILAIFLVQHAVHLWFVEGHALQSMPHGAKGMRGHGGFGGHAGYHHGGFAGGGLVFSLLIIITGVALVLYWRKRKTKDIQRIQTTDISFPTFSSTAENVLDQWEKDLTTARKKEE